MNNFGYRARHSVKNPHQSRPLHHLPQLIPYMPIGQNIPTPPMPPNFIPPTFINPGPYQCSPQTFHSGLPQGFSQNKPIVQNEPMANCPSLNQEFGRIQQETFKAQDQDAVEKWLWKRRPSLVQKTVLQTPVQINKLREEFNIAFQLIKELENGAKTLSVMVKTVSAKEWDEKCKEIEQKKKQLSHISKHLQLNEEQLKSFKVKLLKRMRKRERIKRQAEKSKKYNEEQRVLKQNLHIQIDNWQREMQENVKKIKQEEELQKEADAVLWGVTQKKTEARRQISLLSALLELRQVRVKRLTAAGQTVSQTQVDSFNIVIEMLKKNWAKHLEECALEEHALRGMLTQADVQDDPVKRYKKLVLQEWERAIFGCVGNQVRTGELLAVRESWDGFIVSEETLMCSKIPPGWVLPVPPSSDDWRKLLKY